jgi:hypothetical protein
MVWWYGSIAVGFLLLGLDHLIVGDNSWLILVRFVIAAGFGFLAWFEARTRQRRP